MELGDSSVLPAKDFSVIVPRVLTGKPAFMKRFICAFAVFLALTTPVHAQDLPFFGAGGRIDANRWYVSNGWANGSYQSCEWQKSAWSADGSGLRMTLSDKGGKVRPYGCPEIHTNARFGYGTYTASMRTAKGSGLNTAFFTYIGEQNKVPHDEIDFEFLGKDSTKVQLNHFVNGKPQGPFMVSLGFDASQAFHTYSFHWQKDKISWYVDGKLVYTTVQGALMPNHPGFLFFSLWSGSDKMAGWLGKFAYKAPVTAGVAWAKFEPEQ
jgi:endo-1,3-1,4-beta-glycanase ExoK